MKKRNYKTKRGNVKNLVDFRKVKKVYCDGFKFDSNHEKDQYLIYKYQKKAGQILDFKMQVKFILIDTQKDPITKKVLERRMSFYADFVVDELDGSKTVIDAKGWKTEVYKIKKKLMLYFHGIRIKEV